VGGGRRSGLWTLDHRIWIPPRAYGVIRNTAHPPITFPVALCRGLLGPIARPSCPAAGRAQDQKTEYQKPKAVLRTACSACLLPAAYRRAHSVPPSLPHPQRKNQGNPSIGVRDSHPVPSDICAKQNCLLEKCAKWSPNRYEYEEAHSCPA
jgi:hypothetical protein